VIDKAANNGVTGLVGAIGLASDSTPLQLNVDRRRNTVAKWIIFVFISN
jgi:hypothetical protein